MSICLQSAIRYLTWPDSQWPNNTQVLKDILFIVCLFTIMRVVFYIGGSGMATFEEYIWELVFITIVTHIVCLWSWMTNQNYKRTFPTKVSSCIIRVCRISIYFQPYKWACIRMQVSLLQNKTARRLWDFLHPFGHIKNPFPLPLLQSCIIYVRSQFLCSSLAWVAPVVLLSLFPTST